MTEFESMEVFILFTNIWHMAVAIESDDDWLSVNIINIEH